MNTLFIYIYILSSSAKNWQAIIVLAMQNNDNQLENKTNVIRKKAYNLIHLAITYNSLKPAKPIVIRNCQHPMIMFMIYRLKIYPCFWHKVIYLKPVILVKWPHSKELMLSIYLLSLGANLSTRYSLWWTHSSGEDEGRLLFVVWSSFPIINLTRLLMQ